MFNLLGKILLIVGIIIIIFGYFGPVRSGDPIIGTLFILVGIVVAALAFVFGRNLPPRV